MQFDIYTLIFAGLAIFVAIKLKSVLGTRNGEEKPPFDPFQDRSKNNTKSLGNTDNVIPMPQTGFRAPPEDAPVQWRWEGLAKQDTELANGLDALVTLDKNFDPRHFRDGAKHAYEMIVSAFAHGDRKTLKNLLAKDVFDGFNTVMSQRDLRGETSEVTFVSIDKNDLFAANAKDNTMQIAVRFQSKMISVTRDKNGVVVDGSPDTVTDVTDIWTFARDATAKDPNWKVIATEAGH
jgi:predicted lipid-binding transport protein (Tim44 family)